MNVVEQIKEKYPNPIKAEDADNEPCNYCVGGAFCKFAGYTHMNFPDSDDLTEALCKWNENLEFDDLGESFAEDIIYYNDNGNFEKAWETLGVALTY